VIGDSNADFNYYSKLDFYEKLPSLREYIMVMTHVPLVYALAPQGNGNWASSPYDDIIEDVLLESINTEIPMSRIYRKVKF